MRFLIIGGSDAGISAALRARELSKEVEIILLLADDFPNFSICGLPFFLSGETSDWKSLAHRTEFPGINILRGHTAREIHPADKTVRVTTAEGKSKDVHYDKLLLATGARPIEPHIMERKFPGVFFLHTMQDSFAVQDYLNTNNPRSAVIIGAGYIGLEMADALKHRGMEVTVVGRTQSVLATVDTVFGRMVEEELDRHGVSVALGVEAKEIGITNDGRLRVVGTNTFEQHCDLVLVAVGVQPNVDLGVQAGIATGAKGALLVNRQMETSIPDLYAAGDCVETWHRLLNRYVYLPLGTTAHKQGRITGENVVGGHRTFEGSLGTQVVKIFSLVVARTGLRDSEAASEGFTPFTVEKKVFDHKAYYPGAQAMRVRITGDRNTGRLLGVQIMGQWGSEVSKRADIVAAALFHNMSVEDLNDLDLSYTPPLSSPWDPLQMAAQAWSAEVYSSDHFLPRVGPSTT